MVEKPFYEAKTTIGEWNFNIFIETNRGLRIAPDIKEVLERNYPVRIVGIIRGGDGSLSKLDIVGRFESNLSRQEKTKLVANIEHKVKSELVELLY